MKAFMRKFVQELREVLQNYLFGIFFSLAFLLEMPNYPFTLLGEKIRKHRFYKKCKDEYLEDIDRRMYEPIDDFLELSYPSPTNHTDDFTAMEKVHVALVPSLQDGMELFEKVEGIYPDTLDTTPFKLKISDNKYIKVIYCEFMKDLLVFIDDDLAEWDKDLLDHPLTDMVRDLVDDLLEYEEISEENAQAIMNARTLIIISVSETSKQLNFFYNVKGDPKWERMELLEEIKDCWRQENLGGGFFCYMYSHGLTRIVSTAFWFAISGCVVHKMWTLTIWLILIPVYIFVPYPIWKIMRKIMKGDFINE